MGKTLGKIKDTKNKDEDIPPGMIRIYINGDKTKIHCYPHITIGHFVGFIREELKIPSASDIIMVHNHLVFQPEIDKFKGLDQYNIKNNSCILLCITETNAKTKPKHISLKSIIKNTNQPSIRRDCCRMSINDGYIHKISDLDILTYEQSHQCLQMRCRHGMTKDTLYQYVKSKYESGDKYIKCPHIDEYTHTKCDTKWYHPSIKNVLLYENMNDNKSHIPLQDILKLDVMCAQNVIKNECMMAHCKQCDTWIYRDKLSDNLCSSTMFDPRTKCPKCENLFCWQCNEEWEDEKSMVCTKNCTFNFRAEVLQIIEACPTKKIGRVEDVPSIRCCPQCLQLINHTDACKHVKCRNCQCDFCFVCMGVKNGEWQCGAHGDVCPIAPRGIPEIA
mmetsp:Transcript_47457/g.42550  ORF Transcript_47457/g.42550 Transcript_47457/m.42550 type:complete len:390 (+) Transcript_47457:32-1201(+)